MGTIQLNVEMISPENFLVICSSLWVGVKLAIFFKKQWRVHFFAHIGLDSANVILIISAHFLLPQISLLQMVIAAVAIVSAITDMYFMMTNPWELGKSMLLGAYIIVF